jgi:outer membrane receptor protein involved in Fe transport
VTYNVGASYWRTGDWLPPARERSSQSSPAVFGGLHYGKGRLSLDVTGRYGLINVGGALNPELLTSGFVDFSRPQFSVQQTTSTSLGTRLVVTAMRGWTHAVTAGFDNLGVRTDRREPRFTTPADSFLSVFIVDQRRRWIGYSTTFEAGSGESVSGAFTAGFDHNSQPITSLSTDAAVPSTPVLPSPFAYDLNTYNTGYFVQGQFGLHDALFITVGLRAESNTNFGDSLGTPVSPRAGVSYAKELPGLTVKLRGSWGRAIRAPGAFLKLSLGPDLIPNPRLAPERQRGWDAGLDLQFGNWGSLGLTYYDQLAENLIQQVPIQTQPTLLYQFQNVGRVKNRGLEAEAIVRTGWLQANGTYGYTRARIEDVGPGYTGDLVVGDQARSTPQHTAGVLLTATPRTGTTVTAGLVYVGSYSQLDFLALFRCLGGTDTCPSDFRFATNYPDFAKLNVGLMQRLAGGLSALVRIDNLTNTAVPESGNIFAVMGRITTVGLRFER